MSLRDCLKLQIVPMNMLMCLTPFGRALLKGEDKWGTDDAMLYWIKLPSFGYFYDACWDRDVWGQRVLFWHGREGFSLRWMPIPDGER